MRLEGRLESVLSEVVNAIKGVDGVMGIILFGSVARGEADEGSDMDLLVLFEDEDRMRRGEWEVTRRMPPEVFAQSIVACPSSLGRMNPVFLQSVLEEGIILYAEYPLVLKLRLASATPHLTVSYSLEGLSQGEKQKIDYGLFGRTVGERKYGGIVEKHGGKRLGRGCLLIPMENSEPILSLLNSYNLKYELTEVYALTPQKLLKELSALQS
jgi:hypothetical protein